MNHETAYEWGDASDARVSHLTLNGNGKVVSADYLVDGTEGYQYFCSSTLDFVRGVPWYFTGEEWIGAPKGGLSIAVNAVSGRIVETPQFGHLNHENVVPIKGPTGRSRSSPRTRSGCVPRPTRTSATRSPRRSRQGSFTVWVPTTRRGWDPSADDIAVGDTLDGRFVTIPEPPDTRASS